MVKSDSQSNSQSSGVSTEFLVSRGGETFGPWNVATIAQKLALGEVTVTDFAWDAAANDWVSLLEFKELKNYLQQLKPAAPPSASPSPAQVKVSTKTEMAPVSVSMSDDDAIQWYVTRGQQKFGPFNYYGVVKALQDKSIFEFDFIWKEGMGSWIRLAEHEKFAADAIRSLLQKLESKKAHGEVFAQRRHPRMAVENDVLINDNNTVCQGRMVEGSEGGSGLIIKNSMLLPGQLIQVHFSSLEGLPAFNAVGEIVSKKYSKSARDLRAPIHYGVRFVKMDSVTEERVKKYFKQKALQASA